MTGQWAPHFESRDKPEKKNIGILFQQENFILLVRYIKTTYFVQKRHKSTVMSMEFYKNGHDLLTGDKDGALKCFNCQLRDEDNATRWERWARGPITKVGVINKRIVYGISNRSEATVFLDTKEGLEALYGTVNEVADQPITTTSKAFFREPEFCVGLIKGVNDMLPLVAVHGAKDETFVSWNEKFSSLIFIFSAVVDCHEPGRQSPGKADDQHSRPRRWSQVHGEHSGTVADWWRRREGHHSNVQLQVCWNLCCA